MQNSKKKLLLFDIDGTLITGHGVPKKVVIEVIHKQFPGFTNGHEIQFNGMTDPLIIQQVLKVNGHNIAIDDPLISIILDDFIDELKKHVNPENPPSILPGVRELLEECTYLKDMYLGLVTGNVMAGSKIKLEAVDLYHFFPLGAFGCDNHNRNKLPPIAMKRANQYYNTLFEKENIWIIGDSPKDVECAKENQLKCLAVETGKLPASVFEAAGADRILKDLSDTKKVLEILQP